MMGVPPIIRHPYRAACPGGPCAELGGHRSMWSLKSKPRVRRASPTRQAGGVGANQCRASPQQFRIPTGTRTLAVRARHWVAIEVCGHRSPNHGYGVRPRRDKRVVWAQTSVGRPFKNSVPLPGRVHWRSVRGIGWPWKYVVIEVQTTGTACVPDATSGWCGCKPVSGVPPTIPHPYRDAYTGGPCAELGGHRSMWP